MSLINQMLRDLQVRGEGSAAGPYRKPPARSRRPRRRGSVIGPLRSLPPLLWVGVGGVAGLILLWGVAAWLAKSVGPEAPVPVPQPPPELVAVVARPPAMPVDASAAPRRTPPVPIEVPPPTPPPAYGTSVSAGAAPAESATAVTAPVPTPVLPAAPAGFSPVTTLSRGTTTFFSDRPAAALVAPAGDAADVSRLYGRMISQAPAAAPARPLPEKMMRAADLALENQTGVTASAANRAELAQAALRRALELDPGQLQAREHLVDQLAAAGRVEEAYDLLGQGVAIAPEHTPFRKRAARLLLERGDAIGAVRALTVGGLPRVEADPELHRMLADLYLKLGESFLAVQTGRNLVAYNPREGASWLGLGDALIADGQPEDAHRAYRKALEVGGLGREQEDRLRRLVSQ